MRVRDFYRSNRVGTLTRGKVKEKLGRIVVRWTKMFQLKVSSIRLRGTRQFPRRKCRMAKVGQLRFQESGGGGGGGECIKQGHWRNIFREREGEGEGRKV